jgi:hypothetical protein
LLSNYGLIYGLFNEHLAHLLGLGEYNGSQTVSDVAFGLSGVRRNRERS